MLKLKQITQYEEQAARLIKAFWLAHNDYLQTDEETAEDFSNWTAEGHRFSGLPRDTAFTTSQKTAVLSVLSISEAAAQTLTGSRIFLSYRNFRGMVTAPRLFRSLKI